MTTQAEAVTGFGEAVAQSLVRQAALPAREAALAALGARASEDQVEAWIARHRPPADARAPRSKGAA